MDGFQDTVAPRPPTLRDIHPEFRPGDSRWIVRLSASMDLDLDTAGNVRDPE